MPTLPEPPLRWRRHAAGIPAPGALVGGYTLAEPLGPGRPHCLIFEAHARDGRPVAIQLLSSVLSSDAAFRRRFRRLMRARAAIVHPRVVPIIKSGRSPHGLYVVLASYPKVSLADRLKEGRLGTTLTVRLLTQTVSALITAEAQGLVHDDLTPQVIGIDAAGALLADFGIAARGSDKAPVDRLDLRYASPEQHLGGPLTPRSNVYSLGCILYHCLTGAPPFGAVTGLSQLGLPRPRVTDRRPDLPSAIDAAVGVAMAKLPQRRYATGAGLAMAASAALETGDGPDWDEVAEVINAGTRLDLGGRQPRRSGADGHPHARPRLGWGAPSDAAAGEASGRADEPAAAPPRAPDGRRPAGATERAGTQRAKPSPDRAAKPGPKPAAKPGPKPAAKPGPKPAPEPSTDRAAKPSPDRAAKPSPDRAAKPGPKRAAEPSTKRAAEPSTKRPAAERRRADGARDGRRRRDGARDGRAQPASTRSRRAPSRARGRRPGIAHALRITLVVALVAAGAGGYLIGRSDPGAAERAGPPSRAAAQGDIRNAQHFSATVDTALAGLDAERLVVRRRLASATTPALQTAAAERLARAYGTAAGRLAVVAALDPVGPRLLTSLRAGQTAYAGLAVAARRRRRDAFARSRASVQAVERELERVVLELRGG